MTAATTRWTKCDTIPERTIWTSVSSRRTVACRTGNECEYRYYIVDADGSAIRGPNLKNFRYLGDALRAAVALDRGNLQIATCHRGAPVKFVHHQRGFFRGGQTWTSELAWRQIADEAAPVVRYEPRRQAAKDRAENCQAKRDGTQAAAKVEQIVSTMDEAGTARVVNCPNCGKPTVPAGDNAQQCHGCKQLWPNKVADRLERLLDESQRRRRIGDLIARGNAIVR